MWLYRSQYMMKMILLNKIILISLPKVLVYLIIVEEL